jgi:RNA polymerase sigma-70 factor (ECF subfamily)
MEEKDTEAILLERAQRGDREAFWELAAPSLDPIYGLARRLTKSEEDAEDIVQESFLKALDKIGEFQGKSRFNTWLHRIAVNQGLMKLRKRRADVFSLDAPLRSENGDGPTLDPVDFSESALEELQSMEAAAVLDAALEDLPIDQRTIVVMRDINRLSNDEVAQALELPIGAVKWRLHRARTVLRDRLGEYFAERIGT